jgi:hypothetical protein
MMIGTPERARIVRQLEGASGGPGDVRFEALAGERLGERLGDRALVLDEQDPGPLGDRHAPQCRRGSRGFAQV